MDDGERGKAFLPAVERWNALQHSIQEGFRVWQARLQHPQTQRFARTGAVTLRTLVWRDRVETFVAASQTTMRRMRVTFSLANFVLPVPALAPRGLVERRARRAARR